MRRTSKPKRSIEELKSLIRDKNYMNNAIQELSTDIVKNIPSHSRLFVDILKDSNDSVCRGQNCDICLERTTCTKKLK